MVNMEVKETLAASLERATLDKNVLEQRLRNSLQKEGQFCFFKFANYLYIFFKFKETLN